jgi:hypothetical protein
LVQLHDSGEKGPLIAVINRNHPAIQNPVTLCSWGSII